MERLIIIEKANRQVENLERERNRLVNEIEGVKQLEIDADSKVVT